MLILASKSPTRKTLLANAGLRFSVAAAPIDERAIESRIGKENADRAVLAEMLSRTKALAVAAENPGAAVIGADQTLDFGGKALHKPADRTEAAARLMEMAGTAHRLHAGVALARDGAVLWSGVETATLTFKPFCRKTLDAVLDLEGDAILDSVAGYRLEGPSVRLFSSIAGDYFTILGLPLLPLLAALERHAPEVF